LADFTCRVIEIIRGIDPDFRGPASVIAISAGAIHATGPKLVGTGAVNSPFGAGSRVILLSMLNSYKPRPRM
jgi:hypothetical protein